MDQRAKDLRSPAARYICALRGVTGNMRRFLSGFTFRKLFLLVLIGCLAGGTYATIFIVMVDYLGWPAFFSSVIAFAPSILVSYYGNRLFTFRSRNLVAAEASRYLVAQLLNLLTTSAVVHVAKVYFALSSREAVVAAFVVAGMTSIVLFEVWVHRQSGLQRVLVRPLALKGKTQ